MQNFDKMRKLFILFVLLFFYPLSYAQERPIIHLWPAKVPGETEEKQPAEISGNDKGKVTRVSKVTNPLLEVFIPENPNGSAVIICPGGGYYILAIDKEGYEIAEWFNEMGITAFVLQYRVPKKEAGALQDAHRAIRIVRSRADEWNINTDQIGILGFSAGGSLSARASTRYEEVTYPKVDQADDLSARPDFTMLIYPAYLDKGPDRSITPELNVTGITPPMFIFATADDKHGNSSLVMAQALQDHKVPVDLHFLATGGHGYGLRPGNIAAETWPNLAEKWLQRLLELKM